MGCQKWLRLCAHKVVCIMRSIKYSIRLLFFAYLETLISLGMEADFPNAGKGGLVLMKKLHGACLGDPWSSSVLFRFESLDLEPKSRIYELEDCLVNDRNQGPISIGAEPFFAETVFFFKFFPCFPTSLGNVSFEKLEIEHRSTKII